MSEPKDPMEYGSGVDEYGDERLLKQAKDPVRERMLEQARELPRAYVCRKCDQPAAWEEAIRQPDGFGWCRACDAAKAQTEESAKAGTECDHVIVHQKPSEEGDGHVSVCTKCLKGWGQWRDWGCEVGDGVAVFISKGSRMEGMKMVRSTVPTPSLPSPNTGDSTPQGTQDPTTGMSDQDRMGRLVALRDAISTVFALDVPVTAERCSQDYLYGAWLAKRLILEQLQAMLDRLK